MPLIQILGLLYAGALIENPEKRKKFISLMNSASVSVEQAIGGFMSKGGVVDNGTTNVNEESTDFR